MGVFCHCHHRHPARGARYTDDRRDNFDIYLPLLMARYNKEIFGTLYVAGLVFGLVLWLHS